jgi:hypothetical protein
MTYVEEEREQENKHEEEENKYSEEEKELFNIGKNYKKVLTAKSFMDEDEEDNA